MQDLFRVQNNLMDNTGTILSVMKSGKTVNYNKNTPIKDSITINNKKTSDGKDDGKISFKEKLKNFGKGLIAPIKTMFSSPKNILLTALSVAGGAALIAFTGGAIAPVFVAAGAIAGGFQIGKGIYKQITAKTDDQARKAWQNMGSGTFTLGVSAISAKSSLKAAGVENAKDMSMLQALTKCIKDTPKNLSASFKNIALKMPKLSALLTKVKDKLPKNTKSAPATETEPVKHSVKTKKSKFKIKDDADIKPKTEPDVPEQPVKETSVKTEKPKLEIKNDTDIKPKTEPAVIEQPAKETSVTKNDIPEIEMKTPDIVPEETAITEYKPLQLETKSPKAIETKPETSTFKDLPRLDRSVIEKQNKYKLSYDDVLESQKRANNKPSLTALDKEVPVKYNDNSTEIIPTKNQLIPDIIEDSNGIVVARKKVSLLQYIKNFFKMFGFGVSDK